MSTLPQGDLAALDGPDDWVSLFLNDVGEELVEFQAPHTTATTSASVSEQSRFDQAAPAGSSGSASNSMAPEASNFTESSRIDELCLPTLDDLLADSSDTDPGGLFSGFQCLNNGDLSMHSDDDLAAHQCSCAGIHSCCPDLYSSSDNEQSSITPQATAQGLPPAALPQQQQHSATAKSKAAPHHALPPKHTQPTPPTQPDMPSLAGLTAAQVANAIGFTGQPDNAKPASVLPCGQLPGTEKSAQNPARGNRKRSRDLDSTGITPTTGTGPSSSTAGHSVADPVASRSGSPDVSSSNAGTSGQELRQQSSSQDSAEPDEEQKRQARMQRNRESAHQSRQRKRMQLSEVEQRCEQLKQHNSQLNELVGRLTAENIGLKQQLVGICHQTGTPLPPPPASAVMPPFAFNHMGMPMVPTPKVPIQRMPAARPTPAHQIPAFGQQHQQQQKSGQQPAAPPGLLPTSSSSQTQPAQPQRVRKRVKQAAGAGTVLLALFSFVVFMGPLGPLQRFAPAPQDFAHSLSAETTAGELHSSGRVLMSLPSGSEHVPVVLNETQLQLLHDSRLPKNGVVPLMEGSGENDVATPGRPGAETWLQGQGWWSDGPDHAPFDSPKSIMLKPSDKAAEQQALQGLKDLAPYALYDSYWDQGSTPAHLPVIQSSWQQALPGSADPDHSTSLSGFVGPSMCQQVFQSTATEDSPVQATQRAQRHLAAGTSMRGSGSIALPPVHESGYDQDLSSKSAKKIQKKTIGCGEDDPGVVVSVMLPSKTEGSDTEYTSIDQLYVVVLTPGVKYSTYSCLLPKPILV